MFDDVMGAYGSRFLLAAGGVGLALLVLIGIFWILRSRAPSPFVRGGKNRQPRLQVLDAAAVDTRRRLVLVRRDDVEHLIMIGGPTDIVIESRIGQDSENRFEPAFKAPPAPQPAPVIAAPEPAPAIAAPERQVMPQRKLAAPIERESEAPEVRGPEPAVQPRSAPPERVVAAHAAPAPATPHAAARPVSPANIEPETAASAPQPPVIPNAPEKSPERPAASVIEAASAADVLDAARQRVLPQQRVEPQLSNRPVQAPPTADQSVPVIRGEPVAASKSPPSDFERILQEEMDNTLAAQRVVPAANAPARPAPPQSGSLPRRDPELAPITGADTDLQKEVARIFGEMSVNREK